jgi:hypothetical protein
MSVKNKVLAAAATLTLVGGAGVAALATAGTAHAATPSCGKNCVDIFSHQFGDFANPQFVMDSFKQGDVAGTPIILFRTSNADPAEDFTVDQEGATSEFLAAGLVSSSLALHYGCTQNVFGPDGCVGANGTGFDFEAYEFMYSPFGVQTGLCVGVGATAVAGTKVTLQPCGLSGKTIWIAADIADYCAPPPPTNLQGVQAVSTAPPVCTVDPTGLQKFAQPLVNGSDTNFSEPLSLTYPNSSYPTDTPRPELYTANLLGFSTGAINTNQLWSEDTGILP